MTAIHTALVLGGNSDIALAALRVIPLRRVVLAVRDVESLRRRLNDDPLPIADVLIEEWDALDVNEHADLLDAAEEALGGIDLVLCAVGSLGHGAGITAAPEDVRALIDDNFTGPATALTAAAQCLTRRGHGSIVVVSSVAGLRARRSNYLYGSAKAGLDAFTQGLADAVRDAGVRVHLIRPGFVRSKMTTGLQPAPFSTDTDTVARAIAAALASDRSTVVHVPKVLGPLFVVIRALPRPIWRRVAGNR